MSEDHPDRSYNLLSAASHGSLKKVRQILESGAPFDISARDENRLTILMQAVMGSGKDRPEIVALLIDGGADVNAERGRHVLHMAANHGTPEIIAVLLKRGAILDQATSYGETPLTVAMHEGRPENARALIEAGARLDLRVGKPPDPSRSGKTALEIAAASRSGKIRELAIHPDRDPIGHVLQGISAGESIKCLDAWYCEHRPDEHAAIIGCPSENLDAMQERIGMEFPHALRRLFASCGNGLPHFCEEWDLSTPEQMVEKKEMLTGFLDTNEWGTDDPNVWNRSWLPFLDNGFGDSQCVDTEGVFGGVSGQIVKHIHDSPSRDIEHPSVESWIECLVHALETDQEEFPYPVSYPQAVLTGRRLSFKLDILA